MKNILSYDAGTIAFHYVVLNYLYSVFILLAESLNIMTGLKKEDLLSNFENGKCLSYKLGILEAF